ncbi:hypothetical protein GDO86_017239 [Hymenochirus boettgeri]|uniref:Transmembrane protein 186 n=1 Tax=Hymenochirus boettgeri TaxID=247094 RepID=A0A8T2IPA3_9PIPI|nr:hypothetical protein GDO86_017239 [Hymenochirus boettgeri]
MAHKCVMSTCLKYLHQQSPLKIWGSNVLYRPRFWGRSSPLPTSLWALEADLPRSLPNFRSNSSFRLHQTDTSHNDKFTLIYKFPGISYCRAVSRLKLLQTALTVILLPPVYYYYLQGQIAYFYVVYSTGTALFAAIMLYCLSFYLRKIIGMMYLNEAGTTLKVSHLTFWGKRRNLNIPVDDVKTFSETGDQKHEIIFQFKRYSSPDILYLTLKFGRILDKERFIKVFKDLK